MSKGTGDRSTADPAHLEAEIRDAFRRNDAVAMSTKTVADRVGVDEGTAASRLSSLAEQGVLQKVDLEGEYVAWERAGDTVRGRSDGNSYTIRDDETGLVTRGESRPVALRRLADRIEQYDEGDHVGAQILGISDAAISPAYMDGVAQIREEFVEPDDVHLYAYVDGTGVVEIETPSQLHRSQTILGIAVTAVLDRDRFADVMYVNVETLDAETPVEPDHFPLGVFKVAAVDPDHQEQGIGTALTTHGMAHLAETPPVLSLLWDRDDESNERLAEKFDADPLLTLEDALPFEWRCTVCGYGNECTCDCVLYGWGLELAGD